MEEKNTRNARIVLYYFIFFDKPYYKIENLEEIMEEAIMKL
jgi:hypothetical protein